MKDEDLSRFVDDAVRRAIFIATVREIKDHNANADPAEIEAALEEVRADRP